MAMEASDYTWITPLRLFNRMQGSSMLIIDLRKRKEYNLSHIQTSLHLSLQKKEEEEKEREKERKEEGEEEEKEEDPREENVYEKVGEVEVCLQVKSMRKWQRKKFCSAILYDDCEEGVSPTMKTIYKALKPFVQSIKILQGGFSAFNKKYPFMVIETQFLPPPNLSSLLVRADYSPREVEYIGDALVKSNLTTLKSLSPHLPSPSSSPPPPPSPPFSPKIEEIRGRLSLFSDNYFLIFLSRILSLLYPPPSSIPSSSSSGGPPLPPPPPPPQSQKKKKEEQKEEQKEEKKEEKKEENKEEQEEIEGALIEYFSRTTGAGGVYPSEILENFLYLGGVKSAEDREVLRNLDICYILDLASEHFNPFPDDPAFVYKHLPIDDHPSEDISTLFAETFDFIVEAEKKQKKCLVHCMMGISRSTTILLYYLMREKKMNLKRSFDLISNERPFVNPNRGFLVHLAAAEESLGCFPRSKVIVDEKNPRKLPTLEEEEE